MNNETLFSKLDSSLLWNNLKNKEDPDLQISTAADFRDILLTDCSSVSEYNFILSSLLDEKIKGCVFSTLPHEIIGGILLISELITHIIDKHEELQEFFSRYATYLREILLKCNLHNNISVIALCTQTLGSLVPLSGNYSKRIVESQIKQSIKWISSSYNKQTCCEQHKIAAVWILCEYAISVPILFNVHINEIIVKIVNAIRDKSETVRIGGCKVLNECLKLISKRPHREQTSLSSRIVTDGYQGLLNYHSSNVGVKHGSLLTFECVLNYCINNKVIISIIDFEKLCKLALNEKDNRKPMIKLSVIKLLPLFASYQTSKFINSKQSFLEQSLTYLIKTLQDTNMKAIHHVSNTKKYIVDFRNESFKSIGKIALIVGPKMIRSKKYEVKQQKAMKTLGRILSATKNQSELAKIIKIIAESFELAKNRKKENKSYTKYIKYPLKCLSMLANALNNELTIFLNYKLIKSIFDLGLTKPILKCIQNIYINVVSYQPLIQDRLSRMVWMILLYNMNAQKHTETHAQNTKTTNPAAADDESAAEQANESENDGQPPAPPTPELFIQNALNVTYDDDAYDDYHNIMYYHYKYKNTSFSYNNSINANEYISRYNTNQDIPPFVSPPINHKKNKKSIIKNVYADEPSLGSVASPHQQHQHQHTYNEQLQQQRRRSSLNRNAMPENNNYDNITEFQDKELRNEKLIQLALSTMSKFNLHDVNINLLYFVRETVLFYCNHSNICIRKQAGITCCSLLSRIIQQMEKEQQHLKLHWIEMNNTHSTPNQLVMENSSLFYDKSVTTTPQNGAFYTSPLWAMSHRDPSVPFQIDSSNPSTPKLNQPKSIHIPANMYTNDHTLSEIKDDDEIISHNHNHHGSRKNTRCDGLHMQLSGQHRHESSIIINILAKLLSLAIADVEIEVREQLLLSLLQNKLFYSYLSQQQLLPSLFIALNDESFGVREIALKLLGILAAYNPAHIMPFIRKNLLELLTYLDNRTLLSLEQQKVDISNRQQSAELIGDLIESASTETMKPYVNRIMLVLLRQLKLGDNIFVEISILRTIGKLAKVAQQSLVQYFHKFLPILVNTLNKTSEAIKSNNSKYQNDENEKGPMVNKQPLINKKCVALQTLGQVIESTGLVIQPYLAYKKLLAIILDSLKADQHLIVRREAMQILGILGALDPHIHKTNLKKIEMHEKLQKKMVRNKNKIMNINKKQGEKDAQKQTQQLKVKMNTDNINEDEFYDEEESDFLSESNILLITGSRDPQYYAYVALRALILIVHNASLHEYHRESLGNITKIFAFIKSESISYLQNVIPPILSNLKTFHSASQRAMLLQQLARLIGIVKSHIRTYLAEIFELIHNLWDENAYTLMMMRAIRSGTRHPNMAHNKHSIASMPAVGGGGVYNRYHPYYNHPSSFMMGDNNLNNQSLSIDNDNLMNNDNDMDIYNHVRTGSDSFGPFGNGYLPKTSMLTTHSSQSLHNIASINPVQLNLQTESKQDMMNGHGAKTVGFKKKKKAVINAANIPSQTNIKSYYELQDQLLYVMIEICRAIQDEFKQYLHALLPKLLLVLRRGPGGGGERSTISALNALTIFGNNLQDFLFLVLPPIMELIQSNDVSLLVRIKSIECIGRLSTKCDFNAYTSRIIHPLTHIINTYGHKVDTSLFNATMGTLCLMMIKMGKDYLIFVPMMTRTVTKCKKSHRQYSELLNRLMNYNLSNMSDASVNKLTQQLFHDKYLSASLQKQLNGYVPGRSSKFSRQGSIENPAEEHLFDAGDEDLEEKEPINTDEKQEKLKVAEVMLRKAWDITGRAAERDWFAWLHGFQCELLSQNPRKELRVNASLAQKYKGLANDLFNAAFLSCWLELNDKFQHECRRSLMSALQKTKLVPAKVKKILLGLVEFMDRQNNSIWIEIPVLAHVAELSHSFPNALYYKERQFRLACLTIGRSAIHMASSHMHGSKHHTAYNGYVTKLYHAGMKHQTHYSNNIDISVIHAKFNTSYSLTAESLLKINNQLQQNEAAEGILQYTQMHKPQINIKPTWFEKLNRWEEALDAYSKMHLECPPNDLNANITASLGRMRCLKALGEWDRLYNLANDSVNDIKLELERLNNRTTTHNMMNDANISDITDEDNQTMSNGNGHIKNKKRQYRDSLSLRHEKNNIATRHSPRQRSGFNATIAKLQKQRKKGARRMKSSEAKKDTETILLQFERDVAPLGAMACWNLSKWDKMKYFVKRINANNNFDGAFLRSILSVHDTDSEQALYWIEKCREFLDEKFTSIIVDDYENMYPLCIRAQQLVELEEILLYKDAKVHNNKTKCLELESMWKQRLSFVSHSVEVWQSILSIRQLVIRPQDDVDTWLQFTSLCRKSNRLSMSLKIIANLMGYPNENILFYHQMYYSHNKNSNNNFVRWAPALKKTGSASKLHNCMNDTLTFPLGVRRVQARDVSLFSRYMKSIDVDEKMGDAQEQVDDEQAMAEDKYVDAQPNVAFAYAKHLWSAGLKNQALAQLSGLVQFMESFMAYYEGRPDFTEEKYYYYHHLTASCYLRLGGLQCEKNECLTDTAIDEVLLCYKKATMHDPKSFYSWHAWALMNYQAIQHYEDKQRNRKRRDRNKKLMVKVDKSAKLLSLIPAAVDALFKSIIFGYNKNTKSDTKLQDVLRLLYLWFRYGDLSRVTNALQRGFENISIDIWLSVIPQIIARLHIGKLKVRSLIHGLLVKVGRSHPQSLIFPLTVASKSPNIIRKKSAKSLLDKIRLNYHNLVVEGEMISKELLRVAILWHEMWYEALIEASRLFWGKQRNVNAMILRLKPLYELLWNVGDKYGAKTLREQAFEDAFKLDLLAAWKLVEQYKKTPEKNRNEQDMLRAWEYYRRVYNKIDQQFDKLTDLDLQYVSPHLFNANNLEIVMPGTYKGNNAHVNNVHIFKFNSSMSVFVGTAQRPRKLTILGTDGNNYTFLLKGKEDLRQDERVMQLFGLINRLLKSNNETNKRDLEIRTYAVIPLAPNCGMIGWVSFTDTIHALIEQYRESQCPSLIFGIEHEFVKEEFINYDQLPTINKLEIFKYVLNITKGNDLQQIFWLKSWSAEIWLKKRLKYMRSLGVMSMVGYILGLGDRHPCNLMIHRYTGKVVHIDFGDCFEVAMLREKLPEKVPFRLTRMLINAMEISGFEGNFRINCESVMHLLREHKESVMAVLEALAYDPLMNWRLLEEQKEADSNKNKKKADKKEETENSNKMTLENSSSNNSSSSTDTSPLTPLNSTTHYTPELNLGAETSDNVMYSDTSGIAKIDDDDNECTPPAVHVHRIEAISLKKGKSVRFTADNKKEKEKLPKLAPQIHEIHAMSLKAKKSRSLASSFRRREEEDDLDMYEDNGSDNSNNAQVHRMSYSRRQRLSSLWMPRELDDTDSRDNVNKKAIQVLQRVNMKLRGRDFNHSNNINDEVSNVKEQVQRLFIEATNHENLSQAYLGWCPLW